MDHSGSVEFREFSKLIENHERNHRLDLDLCWRALGESLSIKSIPVNHKPSISDPAGVGKINVRDLLYILRHGVRVQGELEDLFGDYSDQEDIDFEQFMTSITNQQNI